MYDAHEIKFQPRKTLKFHGDGCNKEYLTELLFYLDA